MDSCKNMFESMVEDYMTSRIPSRPVKALVSMLGCFSVLGLLGNSLVLYVYARKRNKLSSTVFIIALAGIDLVTSAVGMPYTMVVEGLNYKVSADFSCKLYYFVITCTVPFSVFIMVAIAIDRYLCICRPHSHVLDSTKAIHSVIILLVIAVVLGVITAMFYGVYVDMSTVEKQEVKFEPLETNATKNSLDDLTEVFIAMKENNCPTCQNHSSIDGEFAGRLTKDVIAEIYKLVCSRNNPLNESYIYTGHCLSNQILFSDNFRRTYQTIYSGSFLFCFFVVFVLYILIYKSVLVRRARRLAARTKTKLTLTQDVSLTENQSVYNESPDKTITMMEMRNGATDKTPKCSFSKSPLKHSMNQQLLHHHQDNPEDEQQQLSPKGEYQNSSCLRDKYFLANIRTAIMLFVVTVAFVIAYLPSWLMAFKVINFNVIIFYVYFSNHIVNPIIYAFMNPAFRRSLQGLLCRQKSRSG